MDISILKNGAKFQITKPTTMTHPFTLCIFYIARLRQEYIWTKPDKKVKYRTRKMTEQEIEQTKISCLKVGIELSNF